MNDTRTLNDIIEFDHVIIVHEDGTITDASDDRKYWAPDVYEHGAGVFTIDDGWELLAGYSGQDRYSGPVMHESEFIAGEMERYIRNTPGVYVAVVVYGGYSETLCDEDELAGWAVARLKDGDS